MDRSVKERLIGAAILVALVVLVVPELLSGPKPISTLAPAPTLPGAVPEPIRNVTVDLTTSKAPANSEVEPEARVEPPAPQSPASAAANLPAPETPAASSTEPLDRTAAGPTPSAAPMKPPARPAAPRSASVESSTLSPISSHGSWCVQLGSFASHANADNLTRQLKGQGFSVFVLPGGSGSSARYRVRVGPLADRASAERMASRLKSLGHVGSLVPPAA